MYSLETFPVGAFQCNCTILANEETREAIIVDPGDDAEAILERVDHHGLTVKALWHTHAHIDHIGATKFLHELLGDKNRERGLSVPTVYLHEEDRWLYQNVAIQAAMLRLHPFEVTSSFSPIANGQAYEGFPKVKALHTPGHTPGSCCLEVKDVSELAVPRSFGTASGASKILLSGDTLFYRSIGRTDLWGGDHELLLKSIRSRLWGLAPDTVVVPGHGPLTSIEQEKAKNPFVNG